MAKSQPSYQRRHRKPIFTMKAPAEKKAESEDQCWYVAAAHGEAISRSWSLIKLNGSADG